MRILFETICIAVGAGILALLYINPPSWPVAVFALWFALSLFVSAAWSLIRHRRKIAKARDEYEAASRELHRRASRDRMTKTRPTIKLTSHALTRMNIQRRSTGRPPLSPFGYYRALLAAPDTMRSQNDWLLWFLLWDVTNQPGPPSAYTQSHADIPNNLEIRPGPSPFGGAGASGMWTSDEFDARDGVRTQATVDTRRGDVLPDPLPERSPSYESTKTPSESESTYSEPSPSYSPSESSGGGGGGGGDSGGGGGGE